MNEEKSIGELLSAARKRRGLTVKRLAEKAEVSRSRYVHYEYHGIIPTAEPMAALVRLLGLKQADVIAAMEETVRRRRAALKKPKKTPAVKKVPSNIYDHLDTLRSAGFCPCRNARFSSFDVLLKICRYQKRKENGGCKACKVPRGKGGVLPEGTTIAPFATE